MLRTCAWPAWPAWPASFRPGSRQGPCELRPCPSWKRNWTMPDRPGDIWWPGGFVHDIFETFLRHFGAGAFAHLHRFTFPPQNYDHHKHDAAGKHVFWLRKRTASAAKGWWWWLLQCWCLSLTRSYVSIGKMACEKSARGGAILQEDNWKKRTFMTQWCTMSLSNLINIFNSLARPGA
jgi:hypothetical protein